MNLEFWIKVREEYSANPYATSMCYASNTFLKMWYELESKKVIMECAKEFLSGSSYAESVMVQDFFLFGFLRFDSRRHEERDVREQFLNYMVNKFRHDE